MRGEPTRRQAAVLDLLRRQLDQGLPSPTVQEICNEFGWRSTRSARDHLRALARKGLIEVPGDRSHRGVRLADDSMPVARVPLVGRVVAGRPVTSEEITSGWIPIPAEWTNGGPHFALRVSGDSMMGAGILEGDHIVVRQATTAHDGDIVVALLNGETTLKRLRRRGGETSLVAENKRYKPILIADESAAIQGIVVGLLRDLRIPVAAQRNLPLALPRT